MLMVLLPRASEAEPALRLVARLKEYSCTARTWNESDSRYRTVIHRHPCVKTRSLRHECKAFISST